MADALAEFADFEESFRQRRRDRLEGRMRELNGADDEEDAEEDEDGFGGRRRNGSTCLSP